MGGGSGGMPPPQTILNQEALKIMLNFQHFSRSIFFKKFLIQEHIFKILGQLILVSI